MKLARPSISKLFEDHLNKRGYPSFWLVNTAGWSIFIFVFTFLLSPQVILQSWIFFINNTVQWIAGYFLTIWLRAIYKKYNYRDKSILRVLGFILFYSIIFSFLLFSIAHAIYFTLDPSNVDKYWDVFFTYEYIAGRTASTVFPLITSWSLLYFGIKFWLDWSKERDRAEKLDLLAQSAQLQMLRYQVNPHFLFNSFSSLRALIRTNHLKAEDMVSKLSEFYRYSLSIKNNTEVSLSEEIEAIENYLEIEKIRFGEKFEYYINIDSLAEEYPVPCFIIHPLVENAIKYGMKTSALPIILKIDAFVKNNTLKILVSNTGNWFHHTNAKNNISTNTGLSNIKNRLELSYPNRSKLDIIKEDGLVKVIIEIYKEVR
jgi:sensor histidine kinase YesM